MERTKTAASARRQTNRFSSVSPVMAVERRIAVKPRVSGNILAHTKVVVNRALEVVGGEAEAMRWLGTPVRALNYATPISLMHDAAGLEAVETVLGRLEHGVL